MISIVFSQSNLPDWNVLEGALGGGAGYRFGGPQTISSFFNLGIINIIFFVAGIAFLLYIITSGVSMMTSKGDPKALEAAKARLTNALIGFVIIFTSYWIVQIVGYLLAIPGFNGMFSSSPGTGVIGPGGNIITP